MFCGKGAGAGGAKEERTQTLPFQVNIWARGGAKKIQL